MRHDVRQLRKNPRIYLDPRSLRSENLTESYLCKVIFPHVSPTLEDIMQAYSEVWLSFNVSVNASLKSPLKFTWALRGHLVTWALGGHSEGTRTLGGHSKGTQALEALYLADWLACQPFRKFRKTSKWSGLVNKTKISSTLIFWSSKLKNGLKKHVRNVAEIKYGFVKLGRTQKWFSVVILELF